jgi:serralysin
LSACGGSKSNEQSHREPLPEMKFCTEVDEFDQDSAKDEMKLIQLRAYKWDTTINELKVYFLDGDPAINDRVIAMANTWNKYGSIKFVKTNNRSDAQIKTTYLRPGYWSHVGTICLRKDTSMCLQDIDITPDSATFKRVVLHEFGHALGFMHEHQSYLQNIKWDSARVYSYYKGPPNRWSKEKIDRNIFARLSKEETNFSGYDPHSIMHYPIPKEFTLDGLQVDWNTELSDSDIVYMGRFYTLKSSNNKTDK